MVVQQLLDQTRLNPSGHAFTAVPLPIAGAYIATDLEGRPVLFVEANGALGIASMRTRCLELLITRPFTLSPGTSPALFHALRCDASDPSEIAAFVSLLEAFVAVPRVNISGDELVAFFRAMGRLFATVPSRDVKSAREGLWGELFLMRQTRGYVWWLPYWHTEPNRPFDFTAGEKRVEVKTALGSDRIHHFAHRQIFAASSESILIASLLVREDDNGLSLKTLISECRGATPRLDDIIKLEKALRQCDMLLGAEEGPSYNEAAANQSIGWYWASQAPHFESPEPAGVSDTRYRVDLSTAPNVDSGILGQWLSTWSVSR